MRPVVSHNHFSHILERENFPPVRLLVVDDVSGNIDVVINYLDGYPVEIQSAEDGQMALEHFRRSHYDVVLMDIRMPVMDGTTAMRIIREIEQSAKDRAVHIVAMTAHAFKEQRKGFIDAGFDDVLIKPFSKDELLNRLIKNKNAGGASARRPDKSAFEYSFIPEKEHFPELPEPLIKMIPGVLQTILDELKSSAKALAANDFDSFKDICHSTKGVAAMYGLEKLTALIGDLEKCAESNDSLTAGELSRSVELYVGQLMKKKQYTCRNVKSPSE